MVCCKFEGQVMEQCAHSCIASHVKENYWYSYIYMTKSRLLVILVLVLSGNETGLYFFLTYD